MDSIWIWEEYLVDIDLPQNPSNHITNPSIYEARPLQNKCVLYSADNGQYKRSPGLVKSAVALCFLFQVISKTILKIHILDFFQSCIFRDHREIIRLSRKHYCTIFKFFFILFFPLVPWVAIPNKTDFYFSFF